VLAGAKGDNDQESTSIRLFKKKGGGGKGGSTADLVKKRDIELGARSVGMREKGGPYWGKKSATYFCFKKEKKEELRNKRRRGEGRARDLHRPPSKGGGGQVT